MLPVKDGRIKSGHDENGVILPEINPFVAQGNYRAGQPWT